MGEGHAYVATHIRTSEDNFQRVGSLLPPCVWVLGTKLRLSVLAAGLFTCSHTQVHARTYVHMHLHRYEHASTGTQSPSRAIRGHTPPGSQTEY